VGMLSCTSLGCLRNKISSDRKLDSMWTDLDLTEKTCSDGWSRSDSWFIYIGAFPSKQKHEKFI